MMIDLFLAVAVVALMVPLLTGYAAYSYGRSFWLWFTLGLILPVVSLGVLTVFLAVRRLNPGNVLVDEAKRILAEAEQNALRIPVLREDDRY